MTNGCSDVAAVGRQTANTGGAHLSEGDLLAGGPPTSTPTSASAAASVRGARELRFDALVGSPLPAQLTAMGYIVEKIGESQRILPHAVVQRFEVSSSGALVAATEGSTRPVSVTVTNAGIATVERFDLRIP
ncbi:hypothetical protein [Bradyrhizobium erythrophlei]|uniref:hypothetical protein n=1 Tax=Bradyrhizobium erythrophlei TaxID=1437360 RepID=UPI0012AC48E4|nr:hypothetical protein [Bradyrhizobium erythrophlei]